MSRYDWPRAPRSPDRLRDRTAHLAQVRPAADPERQASVLAPPPAQRAAKRSARVVAKDAPAPGQPFPWIPVGPSVMVDGQASGNPNVSGRIRDLRIDPSGQRVYAASASGGVWFSPDRGHTWTPLDNWVQSQNRADVRSVANALSTTSLWVDFRADAASDVVRVGTGELTGNALGMPNLFATDQGTPGGEVHGVGILFAVGPGAATNPGHWQIEKGGPLPDAPDATPSTVDADSLRGAVVFRIVAHPDDPLHLYAATDRGLYFGTRAAVDQVTTWIKCTPVMIGPTAPLSTPPIDLVLVRRGAGWRLWIAAYSRVGYADFAGGLAANLTYTAVPLPDVFGPPDTSTVANPARTRLAIALSAAGDRLYVLGRRQPPDAHANPPPQLWQVDAQAAAPTVHKIDGVPAGLFLSTDDQSDYDMAIAAHPSRNDRVIVCGAAIRTGGEFNGAIYRCDVGATSADCTYIGTGVHPDDHIARFAANGAVSAVFLGCDGGVFRSDTEGDDGSFVAVNDGLAVLQPSYLASHPTNAGLLAAGFQDNGTALRVGESVWRQTFRGDGGSVVFHPTDGGRYLRQYTRASWETTSGAFTRPVMRRNAYTDSGDTYRNSETIEGDDSSFYSGADTLQLGTETHLALGSDRVWYSTDFGASWVTLPTATDPRAGDNPDLAQDLLDVVVVTDPVTHQVVDAYYADRTASVDCCSSVPTPQKAAGGSAVLAVKFCTPTSDGTTLRLLALTPHNLSWMIGTRTGTSGPFTWRRDTGLPSGAPTGATASGAFRVARDATEAGAVTKLEALEFLPAKDIVSDVAVHDPTAGTLGSCYVATIGRLNYGLAPTDDPSVDTLYFFDGDRHWWPTGLRAARTGCTWTGTRITAPALGVLVDPEHPETVYVGTSVGVVRGTMTRAGAAPNFTYTWAWESMNNGLPEAAVQDLSVHWYPRPAAFGAPYVGTEPVVKVLRAGLQSRGIWEVDLVIENPNPVTYLRILPSDSRRRLPTALTGAPVRGEQDVRWDASPDVVVDTSDTVYEGPPSEATLWKIAQSSSFGSPAAVTTNPMLARVHVLVHHRAMDAAADVRVALLRHNLPDGDVPLDGLWAALVAAAQSAPASPPTTLPAGWTAADSTHLWRSPSAPVDARTPQAVTFTVDWTGDTYETPFVLVAVVARGAGSLTTGEALGATTVNALVLNSPHAAAKTVQVTSS